MLFIEVSLHTNVNLIPFSGKSECEDIGEKVEKPLEKHSKVRERLFLAEDLENILKVIGLLKAETEQRRWLMFCSNQTFQEDESVSLSFKPVEIVTVALTEGTRYTYFSDRSYFYFELRCFSQKMILMKSSTSQPNQLGSNPSRYVAVGLYAICGKVYV